MNTKEKIAIMQAFIDGKYIQWKRRSDKLWSAEKATDLQWDWYTNDYRIKPEPKIIYVNEYNGEGDGYSYGSKEEAESCYGISTKRRAVKYQEVVDEGK